MTVVYTPSQVSLSAAQVLQQPFPLPSLSLLARDGSKSRNQVEFLKSNYIE